MKCKCGYEWEPRKDHPKACPECKRRLGQQVKELAGKRLVQPLPKGK